MSNNQFPSDVQFAGLIQAATAAAETQEHNANVSVLGKRQRNPDEHLIDTQLRAAHPTGPHQGNEITGQLPSSISVAAVFFPPVSENSKKHSRPPKGTVCESLELTPQRYTDLKEAAKNFMLDEHHMERRNVVGDKKNGGNHDSVKLRLIGCVGSFLDLLHTDGNANHAEAMSNGQWWFGRNAGINDPHSNRPRTFFWPEDGDKIAKLCLPVFRTAVTNERQREYARRTRSQDPKKSAKNDAHDTAVSTLQSAQLSCPTARSPLMIDHTLGSPDIGQDVYFNNDHEQDVPTPHELKLHINVISSRKGASIRIGPRFITTTTKVSSELSALIDEARRYHNIEQASVDPEDDWITPAVKLWLPSGLVRIIDNEHLMSALLVTSVTEWMDSEVRVIIDVGHVSD